MAFDGIVTKAVVSELNEYIIGAKVNKIFEPTKNEIILGLYSSGKNYSLNLSINPDSCRINLSTHSKANPFNAPNFCMLLRKYLIGSRIISINTPDLERVVEIVFEGYNEMNDLITRKLFLEIMSRQSNIIFTNENNIIIDTLKHVDNSSRNLLPANPYVLPNNDKISFLNLKDFSEFNSYISNSELSNLNTKLCSLFIGFSKSFINCSLSELNIDNINYSKEDLINLYNYIKKIISNFGTNNISCTNINSNDFSIILKNSSNLDINFFVDDFYYEKEENNLFKSAKNNLLKIILSSLKKCSKKLENINSKLKECDSMDTYRLYGELLTSNLYKLKENTSSITLENYYDNNNLIEIPLDKSISPHKNADKYFKKYNKLKNALKIVSIQKQEAEKELEYIESIIFSLESAEDLIDINEIYEEVSQNLITKKEIEKNKKSSKHKEKEKISINNITTIEENGFTIFIGKNNIQNDYLTLKYANKNDIWFHTQKIHGSHVILRLNGNELNDDILYRCASIAMQNSKAKNSSNVPVDYTYVRYVKKSPNSKPGMVIYTNYKTIFV